MTMGILQTPMQHYYVAAENKGTSMIFEGTHSGQYFFPQLLLFFSQEKIYTMSLLQFFNGAL
jgi:hypothetical protein